MPQTRRFAYGKTIAVEPVAELPALWPSGAKEVEVPGQADGSTRKSSRAALLRLEGEERSSKPEVGQYIKRVIEFFWQARSALDV